MEFKEAVAARANLYDIATEAFDVAGISSEPVKGGRLLDLGDGNFAKVQISICAQDKVQKYREEYADQCAKNAARAEEKATKEADKAAQAAAKAGK